MRFCILCQEEPVFLGPVLQRVMELHPEHVTALIVAGRRSAGERRRTWRARWESLRIFWHIFEPWGFFKALFVRLRARLLGAHDPRSVVGTARRLGIPVYQIDASPAPLAAVLGELHPDVVLNQSEMLLTKDILSVPRLGFINRHASLLPQFRGRMGAFWSHAAPDPRYGLTIHFVDEGIDTGPIILQREFREFSPSWPYPTIMQHLCAAAPILIWEALMLLEKPDFMPTANAPVDKSLLFPTLSQALEYRVILRHRRR